MAHGAFRTSRQECLMCVSLCSASKNYLPGIFSLHSGNKLLVAQLCNSFYHCADIGAPDSFELPGWVSLGARVYGSDGANCPARCPKPQLCDCSSKMVSVYEALFPSLLILEKCVR